MNARSRLPRRAFLVTVTARRRPMLRPRARATSPGRVTTDAAWFASESTDQQGKHDGAGAAEERESNAQVQVGAPRRIAEGKAQLLSPLEHDRPIGNCPFEVYRALVPFDSRPFG